MTFNLNIFNILKNPNDQDKVWLTCMIDSLVKGYADIFALIDIVGEKNITMNLNWLRVVIVVEMKLLT